MQQPTSVRREHLVEPMIPDVSMATGRNSKSATSFGYFRLFKSSAAFDAEPEFKMVVYDSVQVASQANTLPPLKGKDVTPSGNLLSNRLRPTGSRIERRPAVSSDLLITSLIAA